MYGKDFPGGSFEVSMSSKVFVSYAFSEGIEAEEAKSYVGSSPLIHDFRLSSLF